MPNIIYINPVPETMEIYIFIENQIIHIEKYISPLHFSEEFPRYFYNLIQEYTIGEIWCIAGPGTFTKMRVFSLTINSIIFANKEIIVKSRQYFDIFDNTSTYIPIIPINANEVLIMLNETIQIVNTSELLSDSSTYISHKNTLLPNISQFIETPKYIQSLYQDTPPTIRISPIYIKNPHITGILPKK